jgi:hypothetical protein
MMPCAETSMAIGSPARIHKITKLSTPPRRSSKRSVQPVALDLSRPSPKRSADGLVRPLPKLRSSNHLGHETHQVKHSPSVSPRRHPTHYSGKSTIRQSSHDPLLSIFPVQDDRNGRVTYSTGLTTLPRMSRLRKNKIFTKFATAISEHFGKQEVRKETGDNTTASQLVATHEAGKPIPHGLPVDKLTLAELALSDIEAHSTSNNCCSNEDGNLGHHRGSVPVAKARTALSARQERLTTVEGSPPLEDPFSEESPGTKSTDFEARLKTIQACSTPDSHDPVISLTDPFLTEAIMDTSDNSILKTPPIGSSTPRVQVQNLANGTTSNRYTQRISGNRPGAAVVTRGGQPESPSKRYKSAVKGESPTKLNTSTECSQRDAGSCTPSKARGSSDSTRLSSFPPGSTIRHVPRSMGRLHGLPDLAASAARRKSPKVGRKKHPSPSKRDLDLYGRFMEENVGLGIFKDTDELAMSFAPCAATNGPALAPRDKNNLLRGSRDKYCDPGKGLSPKGPTPGSGAKSRSRIPQPVSQRARSRTEAFARDFAPLDHGDSTMEDELQWNSSTYIVGHGRENRCQSCGSTSDVM